MATSIDAGVRDVVVATNVVGTRYYLDFAPEGTVPPFITYTSLDTNPDVRGDGGALTYVRTLQLDLWMTTAGEDVGVVRTIREALNGARFSIPGAGRFKIVLSSLNRIPEEHETNLAHYAYTVQVAHNGAAV